MIKVSLSNHANTLLFTASQMILFGMLPFISQSADMTESQVVAAFSLGSFLFLFSGPFWGYLSDYMSRNHIIAIGMFGLFTSNFLLSLDLSHMNGTTQVWLSRIIYGLLASSIVPVTQALLIEKHQDTEKLQPLLKNSLSLNIGRFIGPLCLFLFTLVSVRLNVFLSLLTFICFLFFSMQLLRSQKTAFTKAPVHSTLHSFVSEIFKLPLGPALIALLFSVYIGTINTSLAGVIMTKLEVSSAVAARMMAFVLLGIALTAVIIQILLKKYLKSASAFIMISASGLLVIGSGLIFNLTESSLILLVILLGAGLCILPPCYLSLLTKNQRHLGGSTSFAGIISTVGYSIGGFILSFFLSKNISIPWLIFSCSAVLMIVIVIYSVRFLNNKENL